MVPAGMEASITMLLRRGIGNTETRKLFTDTFFRVGRFWPPKPTSALSEPLRYSVSWMAITRPVWCLNQPEGKYLVAWLTIPSGYAGGHGTSPLAILRRGRRGTERDPCSRATSRFAAPVEPTDSRFGG